MVRRRKKRTQNRGVPPAEDPRWEEWTRSLFAFIHQKPRTWPELLVWGEDRGIPEDEMRQHVGYLEFRYRVETFPEFVVSRGVQRNGAR